MSRRTTARPRRADEARGRDASPPEPTVPPQPALLTQERDGLLLIRSPQDDAFTPADAAEVAALARTPDPGAQAVTVLVSPRATAAGELWSHLGTVLDGLGERGVTAVRLAMSGTGADLPDRPPVARWIAEAWRIEVTAPVGNLLAVPGGTLFSCGERAGWRRFVPGAEPVDLGPRLPVPPWSEALDGVPAQVPGGSLVEHLPAGLLIRPPGAESVRPGSLSLSIPVEPAGPALVVGVPGGEDVPVRDVLAVFDALPEQAGAALRLVPGGRRDLLALGQAVADARRHEVVVLSGVPVLRADGAGAAAAPVGEDGLPRWHPFVGAVLCRPARKGAKAPAPGLLDWSSPFAGRDATEHGDFPLSARWQATVTRAGFWVRAAKGARPAATAEAVAPEGPAIEVGRPGQKLDPSVWPLLAQLLGELPPDVRGRAALLVHGTPKNGEVEPRRLATDYGLRSLHFGSQGRRAQMGTARTAPEAADAGDAPDAGYAADAGDAAGPRSEPEQAPAGQDPAEPAESAGPTEPRAVPARPDAPDAGEPRSVPEQAPAGHGPAEPAEPRTVPAGPGRVPPGTVLRRSDDAERAAFRAFADGAWRRHRAAVEPLLARMQTLRGKEREAARADLIALRLYLGAEQEPFAHATLARALRAGTEDEALRAYGACVASALQRLPVHAGLVLRAGASRAGGGFAPGVTVVDAAPVSGLAAHEAPAPGGDRLALWSVSGRNVTRLLDGGGEEVVFAPGTPFRVLAVRDAGGATLTLARELSAPGAPTPGGGGPHNNDASDEAVLARLDEAVGRLPAPADTPWPGRCAGPLGSEADAEAGADADADETENR
ncbi:hypothetical protein [Streptomyces sp. SBT349]|uniref:hypothetical protein n=1 Tax=Streptomyces sp. SBT349 TaxID=1580539 RepID=UPI00066C0A1A|nr:hypothetical protein [Streptomyces sp. SBT349]